MVKNENELLGLLIRIQDDNRNIDNAKLLEVSKMDGYSLEFLMKPLIEKHYVIYSMDTTTLTSLGIANYISPWKKALSWSVTLLKFAVSYTLGIFSGIIAAWLMIKLGIQ